MVTIKLTTEALLDQKTECVIIPWQADVPFAQQEILTPQVKKVLQQIPHAQLMMKEQRFTGHLMSKIVVPYAVNTKKLINSIFIGLGKANAQGVIAIESYRRFLGQAVREAFALKASSLALQLPDPKLFDVTYDYLAKQTATILHMAHYHFDEFITDADAKAPEVLDVTLCVDAKQEKQIMRGILDGECIARAVNKARHWVDLPPTILTPPHLADKAREIAKKHALKITIFDENEINKMGMGGLAAVSRGSELDCCLVIMEYKVKTKNAPTIGLVGKGITFDSGGLSLKPAVHMETMKEDMSGAAAVIAAMDALATLQPKVNIVAITPLAENLPSGKAVKPGDIVRFYNGKTAEIKNTDAEGRLILADALSYMVKHYKPTVIVDFATLTGACAHALGPFFSGLMSKDKALLECIEQAANLSGDRVWQFPFDDDYKKSIKSSVADLSNTGNPKYMAGAITAGFFLSNFVNDVPWAHLDIAGTAFDVPDIPYYRDGATGVGVRLMVELVMNWK